jgi:hypothetical protein
MLQGHRNLIERSLYLERLFIIKRMWLCICHDHRDFVELRGRVPLSRANTKVMNIYLTGDLPGLSSASVWSLSMVF